jgi:ubiquitin-activating enzyme E1
MSYSLYSPQVVVLTDSTFDVALKINDFCHTHNICFLSTQSRGVFGNIFVDFGTSFVIHDNNGEAPASAMVSAITQATSDPLRAPSRAPPPSARGRR